MAYRVNGVECDTPEEVLKLLEASRSASVQIRTEHAERSAAGSYWRWLLENVRSDMPVGAKAVIDAAGDRSSN